MEVGCLKWIGAAGAPGVCDLQVPGSALSRPPAGLPGSARGWAGSRVSGPGRGAGGPRCPRPSSRAPHLSRIPKRRRHGGQDWGPCRPGRPSGRSGSECPRPLPQPSLGPTRQLAGDVGGHSPPGPPSRHPWRLTPTHQLRRGLGSGKGTERRRWRPFRGARPRPPGPPGLAGKPGPRRPQPRGPGAPACCPPRAPSAPQVTALRPPASASSGRRHERVSRPGLLPPSGRRARADSTGAAGKSPSLEPHFSRL